MSVERWSPITAVLMLALVACGESVSPFQGDDIVLVLSARSSTSQSGVVGAEAEPPEVSVLDSAGRPVSGVTVSFHIVSGDGAISASRAVSNRAGVASLSRWVLGTTAGLNVIVATAGSFDSVVFRAITVPGPPALLSRMPFDVQEAPAGTTLDVRLRVRLTDRFGNGLGGIEVKFTVEDGGGTLTRDLVLTDSVGVAESGNWTLGAIGLQRVVARAGSLVAEPFTAVARPRPFGCASESILLHTAVTGELTAGSCKAPDGRTIALYTLQLLAPSAFTFTMASPEFDTYLELRDVNLQEVARNDNVTQLQAHSAFKAVLPAGTYFLIATSASGSAVGRFTVAVNQDAAEEVRSCEEVFIVRNAETMQTASSRDCVRAPFSYSDRYLIHLYQGMNVKITVEDWNYSGPTVELLTSTGTSVFGAKSGFYVMILSYTAERTGYYTFHVGLGNDENQQYKLTIR